MSKTDFEKLFLEEFFYSFVVNEIHYLKSCFVCNFYGGSEEFFLCLYKECQTNRNLRILF